MKDDLGNTIKIIMKKYNDCNFADDSISHVYALNNIISEKVKSIYQKRKIEGFFHKFNKLVKEYKTLKNHTDVSHIIDDFRNRAKRDYCVIIKNTVNITDINHPLITHGFTYISTQTKEIKRHLNINQQTKRK